MSTGTAATVTRDPRLAAARRLLRRSAREQVRAFLVEGPQGVREALTGGPAGSVVTELFSTQAAADRYPGLLRAADAAQVPVRVVQAGALAALTGTVTPQGMVAVCGFVDVPLALALAGSPALVVVLVEVRDPGNAGTVLRAADAAGADAVVLTTASVDLYNDKCVRSCAGSVFHLPVVRAVTPPDVAAAARGAGLQVLAADTTGELDLDDALDGGWLNRPTAWLFGNEAHGLAAPVLGLADATVRVPIHGAAESLNLATAAAVCLYYTARAQRGRAPLVAPGS